MKYRQYIYFGRPALAGQPRQNKSKSSLAFCSRAILSRPTSFISELIHECVRQNMQWFWQVVGVTFGP